MSDKQFTLFDLTFENSEFQFGPRAFPGGSDIKRRLTNGSDDAVSADGDDTAADSAGDVDRIDTDEEETAEESQDDGRSRLGDLFRFALIGLLAIVAQRLLADDDDGSQLDNVTDLGVVSRGRTEDDSPDGSDDEMAADESAAGDDEAVSIDIEDAESDDSSSEGRSMTTTILLLGVLVAVAFVAKKFLGADELEALDELDDVTAEP